MEFPSIYINFEQKRTIGEQIVVQLTEHMLHQRLQPGDQLPTVRELAAQLRVNFNTVARAYRVLDAGGWISTQQGRGTYVRAIDRDTENEGLSVPAIQTDTIKELILLEAARAGVLPGQILAQLRSDLIQEAEVYDQGTEETVLIKKQNPRRRKPGWIRRRNHQARQIHSNAAAPRSSRRKKISHR